MKYPYFIFESTEVCVGVGYRLGLCQAIKCKCRMQAYS